MASGTFYPAVSGDDGRWETGTFISNSIALIIGNYSAKSQTLFARFPSVNIPQGSTIDSAFVKLTAYGTNSDTIIDVNIYFNDIDNAIAPTDETEADALALTTNLSNWIPGGWTDGVQYDSPSLVSVLQEVIDRGGWSSGNALQVVIKDNGSSSNVYRFPSAIDHSSGTEKAELHVTWSTDVEVTFPNPLSTITSLQSNIQVELVPSILQAESSMSVGELFWGTYVELPSPFAAQSSLQAKTDLEIAVTPLIAQTNLQSNLQIELVPPVFTAQGELSVDKIFWGHQVELPEPFSANAFLQANTQIEIVPSPLIVTGVLFSNLGIEVSAGSLNTTGAILATPVYPIILTGTKRIYLFTLTGVIDGVEDIIIPISSFQSRIKSGDPTYLSVVIPGIEYASAINERLNGDLIVRMGYQDGDEILLTEVLSRVLFENITIYEGAVSKSITLDGHKTETWMPKTVNLENASYRNFSKGKLRYRCKPDLYLRPGDVANINDDSFTVESITYSVSPMLETYEVAE